MPLFLRHKFPTGGFDRSPFPPDGGAPVDANPWTVLYGPDDVAGEPTIAPAAPVPTTGSAAGAMASPFVINIVWDSSVSSAPAGFTSAVLAAAQYLESKFTDPVTINVGVGWGEVAGNSLGGALGESESYLARYSYTALRNAAAADAATATDRAVLASLPTSTPVNGTFWVPTAEAKALGLISATRTSIDGYVGFSSSVPYTFNDSSGVTAGTYDFTGVALHELTETMGRMLIAGGSVGSYASSYTLMDLLHYASPGVRDFSAGTAGYFSPDGGTTSLGAFNTASGGDAGDWSSSVANDAFDAFSRGGVTNAVTANDLSVMDAIGWNPAGTSAPTGVSVSPVTAVLGGAAATQSPTFIHASGGTDTLDVPDRTGRVRPAGGVDSHRFGSAADSTTSAADIITSFHGAGLTNLGQTLTCAGGTLASSVGMLAADPAGGRISGDNTLIHVNTSPASAAPWSAA